MRSFWLLLLVFVLPLQMSWAAAHFCDDERLVAHAVAAAEIGEHVHQATLDKQSDANAEKIADACCGAAHGCHGLHHLMAPAEASQPSPSSAQAVAPRDVPSKCSVLASRVERPKWLAA